MHIFGGELNVRYVLNLYPLVAGFQYAPVDSYGGKICTWHVSKTTKEQ